MAGLSRRDRFELPEPVRRFFEGDWDVASGFPIEEYRDGQALVVRADLPDIDPDTGLDVTVADGVLRIHAERREESSRQGREGYRSEFRYGSMTREVRLPQGASADDVAASYRDGVLEVRVPLPAAGDSGRKVPITRS